MFIVDDLMAHINGRAVLLKRAFDDVDGAHHACTKSARLSQDDPHRSLSFANFEAPIAPILSQRLSPALVTRSNARQSGSEFDLSSPICNIAEESGLQKDLETQTKNLRFTEHYNFSIHLAVRPIELTFAKPVLASL
jgi:hypothetical protein